MNREQDNSDRVVMSWPRLVPLAALSLLASCDAAAPGVRDPDASTAALRPTAVAERSLRVSNDSRRIVRPDGSPFFWLGDTAWELFHRLTREEADLYLTDRAAKGFNVVLAVVLAELDGLRTPNPYGEVPLRHMDPTQPNEAYFKHVDGIVDRAAELGMFVGMLPTWGDKFNRRWGVGPEIFTRENAGSYGEFLGRRYRDKPVIWILGGDRAPESDEHYDVIRAMAEGIRAGDGGRHLRTYHPVGERKSWEWFHAEDWLDLNLFQSSHGAFDTPNFRFTLEGYALDPAKPVLDGEPRYEDHPVNWDPSNGWFDSFDVRQAAYWSVLSGAAGHTYGNHNIWQMYAPGREPVSSARTPWTEALTHEGAAQVGFMKRLLLSRPWMRLIPDDDLVTSDGGGNGAHVATARDTQGRFAIIYSPYGSALAVNAGVLGGERVRAWWFDPRTGTATAIGTFASDAVRTFDPPGEPRRGNDWALVLDDADAGFGDPGLRR